MEEKTRWERAVDFYGSIVKEYPIYTKEVWLTYVYNENVDTGYQPVLMPIDNPLKEFKSNIVVTLLQLLKKEDISNYVGTCGGYPAIYIL